MPATGSVEGTAECTPSAPLRRLPSLDGLRACAILLVLLYHLTPNADADRGIQSLVFKVAEFGWSGVDLFFVLSGFLITRIVCKARSGRSGLADFYRNRLLRILPLYYLALLAVFIVIPLVFSLYPAASVTELLVYLLCLQNFVIPIAHIDEWIQLGHFWSIGVEVQFYLLWPVLVYRLEPGRLIRLIIYLTPCLLLIRSVAVYLSVPWEATFSWTPFRVDALLLGALVALLQEKREDLLPYRLLSTLTLLITGAVLAWFVWRGWIIEMVKPGDYPVNLLLRSILPTLVALFYAALLVVSLTSRSVGRFFAAGLFQPIARYSYGTYVIHFLMVPMFNQLFAPLLNTPPFQSTDFGIYAFFLICSAISITAAALSYHLFEIRFLRLKRTGAPHA